MTLPSKPILVAAVPVAALLGVLIGRFTVHPRVETVEKVKYQDRTVWKDRIVEAKASSDDTSKVKAVRTVTVVKTRWLPGGVVEKEATTTAAKDTTATEAKRENTHRTIDSEAQKATVTEMTKTVTVDARPNWSVSLMPGIQFAGEKAVTLYGPGVLGASVERRIIGPVWMGAWGSTSGAAGISIRSEW